MILDELKFQTRSLHETLDASPALRVLFTPGLSKTRYVALLEILRSIYEPLERNLGTFFENHPIDGLDFAERRKLPLLDRDLGALNGRKTTCSAAELNVHSPAIALGCLYVLEGATLGGQVIARAVQRRLGLDPENGLAFFASYQDRVADKWRAFRNVVENTPVDEPQCVEMIEAAKKTFAIFIAHFGGPQPT